jgi:hypothetical protein
MFRATRSLIIPSMSQKGNEGSAVIKQREAASPPFIRAGFCADYHPPAK